MRTVVRRFVPIAAVALGALMGPAAAFAIAGGPAGLAGGGVRASSGIPGGAARGADDIPVPPETMPSGKGGAAVSAADRDFVIKVRLAGLWEIPAGNLAQERSRDPRIVTIGREIAAQHVVLDRLDRAVARTLGIELPDQPTGEQLGWLAEMRGAAKPAQFDQIFIDRLRAAHGKIFPVIATIRAGTRNDAVRRLAQQANQFVMTHMTLLESSGIVDYGALPTAPPPAGNGRGPVPVDHHMLAAAHESTGGPSTSDRSVLVLVLAAALLAGVVTTIRILRSR